MPPHPDVCGSTVLACQPRERAFGVPPLRAFRIGTVWFLTAWILAALAVPAQAVILWSDLGATLVHESGIGSDILGGPVKRNDSSSDTLYFKFHVDPLSDMSTE